MPKNKDKKDSQFRTSIGGQALIEGIMMRGPQKTAIAVRGTDGIKLKEQQNKLIKDKYPILGWVFIRGVVGFVSSMAVGMKALTWSAEQMPEDDYEPGKFDKWMDRHFKNSGKIITGVALVLGLALAIGLFTLLPTFLGSLIAPHIGTRIWLNLIETGIRLTLLVGYMFLVSRMKDIQRTFAYHGAEHKTIACYEARKELTVENVRGFTRLHPRCGTSFLLTVVIVSLLVFMWVTVRDPIIRIALRLAVLPLVVGVSYEINRLIGRFDNPVTRFFRAPGLWMQHMTTREPDDAMIEVGIAAMMAVIPEKEGSDDWSK